MFHFARHKSFLPASWNRVFVITFVFITLASGLFWLDFFRSYSAEVTILVVSRPGVSQSAADIADNLAGITRTLSFYDRVLANNDLIDDAFDGSAPDVRKARWNDAVSVKRLDGASILSVRAFGDTPEAAKLLAMGTAQTLFSMAGLYYNVKTDIDLRIIDGPLVSYVLVKPLFFGAASLLSGFFATTFFFLLLNAVPGFFATASPSLGRGQKEVISLDEILAKQNAVLEKHAVPEKAYPEFALGETVPWIDPRKFVPTKPTTLSFENAVQETKKSSQSGMRAPAPLNLPVASSEMELPVMDEAALPASSEFQRGEPFTFEAMPEELDVALSQEHEDFLDFSAPDEPDESLISAEITKPALERGEPTADEYRHRLNKLLSGGN